MAEIGKILQNYPDFSVRNNFTFESINVFLIEIVRDRNIYVTKPVFTEIVFESNQSFIIVGVFLTQQYFDYVTHNNIDPRVMVYLLNSTLMVLTKI